MDLGTHRAVFSLQQTAGSKRTDDRGQTTEDPSEIVLTQFHGAGRGQQVKWL